MIPFPNCVGDECPPPCAPGTYGPDCLSCEPGTYSQQENARRCMRCHVGWIAPSPGSTYCTPCPTGTTSTNGIVCLASPTAVPTQSPTLSTCPAGQGNMEWGGCWDCPNGSASPGGFGAVCTPCEPGTYTWNNLETTPNDFCKKCDVGYIAPVTSSILCIPCPAYHTSTNGITCTRIGPPPLVCQAGYAQSSSPSSACEPCPAGSYSPGGYSACAQCNAGYASVSAGSESCFPCYISNSVAPSPGSTECTSCPYRQVTYDGIYCRGVSPPATSPSEPVEAENRRRK
jgi:hypothetical protein